MTIADGFHLWLGKALAEVLLAGVCMAALIGFIALMLWLEKR